jgi:hypothetical protein
MKLGLGSLGSTFQSCGAFPPFLVAFFGLFFEVLYGCVQTGGEWIVQEFRRHLEIAGSVFRCFFGQLITASLPLESMWPVTHVKVIGGFWFA